MKIKIAYPPNIEKIKAKFGLTGQEPIVFTYGEILYNPNNGNIDEALKVHESVHIKQQGKDPEGWWNKYLENESFRLEQEIEAYIAQFKKFKTMEYSKKQCNKFLDLICFDLSGKMYGNCISFRDAHERIRKNTT